MNPIATAVIAGTIVIVGKWARDQSPNIDNAVGVVGIAIGLAVLEQIDARIAAGFGALILTSLLVVHLPVITKAAGLSK